MVYSISLLSPSYVTFWSRFSALTKFLINLWCHCQRSVFQACGQVDWRPWRVHWLRFQRKASYDPIGIHKSLVWGLSFSLRRKHCAWNAKPVHHSSYCTNNHALLRSLFYLLEWLFQYVYWIYTWICYILSTKLKVLLQLNYDLNYKRDFYGCVKNVSDLFNLIIRM